MWDRGRLAVSSWSMQAVERGRMQNLRTRQKCRLKCEEVWLLYLCQTAETLEVHHRKREAPNQSSSAILQRHHTSRVQRQNILQ